MGLFDSLKDMGSALGGVVNNAVNDYKEKKAYEAAESEMRDSIIEEQYLFIKEHVDGMPEDVLLLVMKTALLYYDSFKKDNYADSFDIIDAIATGEEISSWASEYNNAEDIESAYIAFYKKYVDEAVSSEWYKGTMEPFYEEEALDKLVRLLHDLLSLELPDKAMAVVLDKYGDDANGLRLFLEDKKYNFYDPFVVWALNSFEDDDVMSNLENYEKRCLKKFINIVRNTRLAKYGLKDSDAYQIRLEGQKITCCAAIRDNCFCYMPITFSDVKTLNDLKKYTTLEATKIPLSEILYWKQYGEQKTEIGLKKESAFVNAYAASKGIVVPKQLEERKIDTRYIALVYEKGQLDLDYACVDAIKALIPQYEFDRVQVQKPEVPKAEEKVKEQHEEPSKEETDVIAAFEKIEKLKSMGLISDEEYETKRAELMSRI